MTKLIVAEDRKPRRVVVSAGRSIVWDGAANFGTIPHTEASCAVFSSTNGHSKRAAQAIVDIAKIPALAPCTILAAHWVWIGGGPVALVFVALARDGEVVAYLAEFPE